MEYVVMIVTALIAALASFGGAALANRAGFAKLETEFYVKQQETDRRIDRIENKIDKIMEAKI